MKQMNITVLHAVTLVGDQKSSSEPSARDQTTK